MSSDDPRGFWEHNGFWFDFENQLEEYEQYPRDEWIGAFLAETMRGRLEDLGNGIYARDNSALSNGIHGIPPMPHDLAAKYLGNCATALQRLADLEQRRADAASVIGE